MMSFLNYAIFEEINNIDNADVLICNALIENEKHETHKLYSTNGMQKECTNFKCLHLWA